MSVNKLKIDFIGGGNMATALISGLIGQLTDAASLHVIDPNAEARTKLEQRFGVGTSAQIDDSVANADVIVLAVKPQQMKTVITMLRGQLQHQLVLSIAAGIRATDLARWLGDYQAIVRCMPNTPALIGKGVSGLFALAGVNPQQRQSAEAILTAVGATVWLTDEAQIDAVTALSGSGPAYVFYFLEAMQQAALELGLSAQQGATLAMATFAGATQLAVQADEPLALLRQRVTSKGGTTYAALNSMETSQVRGAIVQAIHAAAARSRELGEEFGRD